jgi:hypothetical protein
MAKAPSWLLIGVCLAVALGIGSLLFRSLLTNLAQGNRIGVAILVIAVVFTAGMLIQIQRQQRQMVRALLCEPTAEPYIAWFTRATAQIPGGALQATWLAGVLYAYYGEFACARAQLARLTVGQHPREYSAEALLLAALLDHLELQRHEEGYQRALEARERAVLPRGLPGSRTARQGYDAYVVVGELLRGNPAEDVLAAAEQLVATLPLQPQVLVLASLAYAYKTRGDAVRAQALRDQLAAKVPHARGLYQLAA